MLSNQALQNKCGTPNAYTCKPNGRPKINLSQGKEQTSKEKEKKSLQTHNHKPAFPEFLLLKQLNNKKKTC